jgi:hypothetical protein
LPGSSQDPPTPPLRQSGLKPVKASIECIEVLCLVHWSLTLFQDMLKEAAETSSDESPSRPPPRPSNLHARPGPMKALDFEVQDDSDNGGTAANVSKTLRVEVRFPCQAG